MFNIRLKIVKQIAWMKLEQNLFQILQRTCCRNGDMVSERYNFTIPNQEFIGEN